MKKNLFVFLTALMAVCMTSCGPVENTQINGNETAVTEVTYAAPETTTKAEETKPSVSETAKAAEAAKEEKASTEKSDSAKKTDSDKKTEDSKKSDGANKYGYYRITEVPQTSISVASLTGDWTDGGSFLEFANCDFLEGRFRHVGGDKSVSGTVVLEYGLNPDNTQTNWFNLYDDDGNFYLGFAVTGEVPFNDLYAGQSGEPHFKRYTGEPTAEDFLGEWENGGVTASIRDGGDGTYTVLIHWPESEDSVATDWEYICYFEQSSGQLLCNERGLCIDKIPEEDGTYTSDTKSTNSSAIFSIYEGQLTWQDDNESRDDGWAFLRN